MEIECFVIVACPENSIVESKVKLSSPWVNSGLQFKMNWQEFFKPIVTPYELEIALQPEQSWTGRYVLDFGKLLTQGNASVHHHCDLTSYIYFLGKGKALDIEDPDDDHPVFSLVTGTYRHPKQFGGRCSIREYGGLSD